jgi:hypothetical protein
VKEAVTEEFGGQIASEGDEDDKVLVFRGTFFGRIASQPVTGGPKEGTPYLSSREENMGGAFGTGPVTDEVLAIVRY